MNESDAQQVARYLGGLRQSLHEKIGLQVLWTVDEAHNMALKAELMERTGNRSGNYRHDALESSDFPLNKGKSPPGGIQPQLRAIGNQQIENRGTNGGTGVRQPVRNPNMYSHATPIKCYKFGQPGHRSNKCPARKPVNLVEQTKDYKKKIEEKNQ